MPILPRMASRSEGLEKVQVEMVEVLSSSLIDLQSTGIGARLPILADLFVFW